VLCETLAGCTELSIFGPACWAAVVQAVARAEAEAGVERPPVVAQRPEARTAAERPAEVVVAAARAKQPGPAVHLAVAELKPRAAQPTVAGFLAVAGPKPLAVLRPAVGVAATVEQPPQEARQPAGPQQVAAGAEGAEEPQVAVGPPEAWPQPWAAVWAANRPGSRTPRDRKS
jgi:hypothetical protein